MKKRSILMTAASALIITAAFAFTPAKQPTNKSGDPLAGWYYTSSDGTTPTDYIGTSAPSNCSGVVTYCAREFSLQNGVLVPTGQNRFGTRH